MAKVEQARCCFCGDGIMIGLAAQQVTFPSGIVISPVHEWRCKESLYPIH